MAIKRRYNLSRVQITLGNDRIQGWGATDAVTIAPTTDNFEPAVSGDGQDIVFSRNNNNLHTIVFTVAQGSVGHNALETALRAQLVDSDAGTFAPLAFQLYDPDEKTRISDEVVFSRDADTVKGSVNGEVAYNAWLPDPTKKVTTDS